jgi:hypothetical protein
VRARSFNELSHATVFFVPVLPQFGNLLQTFSSEMIVLPVIGHLIVTRLKFKVIFITEP